MTTANIGPLAPFRYTFESDTWWWSDDAFRVFGFAPGEVVPTTELILRHQHPEDVDATIGLARSLLERGQGFCLWHRIIDARRRTRQLLTVGEGVWDTTGRCLEMRGSFLDVTRALRVTYARDIDEAVRASARTRASIEQAKGVLMLVHRISPDEAFEALRRLSQVTNVKVRDIAAAIMTAVVETGRLPAMVRQHMDGGRGLVSPGEPFSAGVVGAVDGVDGVDGVGGVDDVGGVDGVEGDGVCGPDPVG